MLDGMVGDDAVELAQDVTWIVSCVLLADSAVRLGDERAARPLLAALEPHVHRNATLASAAFLGPVARPAGALASLLHRHDAALTHLAAARRAAERGGMRAVLAWVALDEAAARRRRGAPGDAAAATAALHEAQALGAQTGLEAVGARARALLDEAARRAAGARHGGSRRGRPAGADASLRREGDVWTLALDGRTLRVRHAKGVEYLATLLEHPDVEVHALDLAGAAPEPAPRLGGAPAADAGLDRARAGRRRPRPGAGRPGEGVLPRAGRPTCAPSSTRPRPSTTPSAPPARVRSSTSSPPSSPARSACAAATGPPAPAPSGPASTSRAPSARCCGAWPSTTPAWAMSCGRRSARARTAPTGPTRADRCAGASSAASRGPRALRCDRRRHRLRGLGHRGQARRGGLERPRARARTAPSPRRLPAQPGRDGPGLLGPRRRPLRDVRRLVLPRPRRGRGQRPGRRVAHLRQRPAAQAARDVRRRRALAAGARRARRPLHGRRAGAEPGGLPLRGQHPEDGRVQRGGDRRRRDARADAAGHQLRGGRATARRRAVRWTPRTSTASRAPRAACAAPATSAATTARRTRWT